jgi:hypothetical protein
MLALEIILEFACCCCGHDVGVTLKCEGKGLVDGMDLPTKVKVPCPACCENNIIYFTPRGTLLRVAPEASRLEILVPSCN